MLRGDSDEGGTPLTSTITLWTSCVQMSLVYLNYASREFAVVRTELMQEFWTLKRL